ncbi:MAG: hypothetical protein K0S41_2317 [Anaerocolumna sp.]|nr:hypothetical protein [Anaerocolumna sp.]
MRMKKIKGYFSSYVILMIVVIIGVIIGVSYNKKNDSVRNVEKQQPINEIDNTKQESEPTAQDSSIVYRMDYDLLSNEKIKEIVEDKNEILENGIYGFNSDSEDRYYILINGVDYWYSNISFSIADKILTITYDTKYENGLRYKQFFMINPNNKEEFDKVELINNNEKKDSENKETFKLLL